MIRDMESKTLDQKTTWERPHCGMWNSIANEKTCFRCGTLITVGNHEIV